MCGLNGVFAYGSAAPPPDEREILVTRDAMQARGPDGLGAWRNADGRCALGHRRLAVIDLADRALQPMSLPEGGLCIVFNGEIYNLPELRAELEAQGRCFRTTSDTEMLLHLYAVSGPEMVHRLRGMYAFAIWDQRRGGLLLARDPYGIKPLYVADDGRTIRFASQVKALLASGAVSRDLEPAGVVGFHIWGSVPEPFTLYRSVRALPAGHRQWIDSTGTRGPVPFADTTQLLAEGAQRPAPSHETGPRVQAAVLDSVRAHLLADVDVGLFLSAGVDSGALLGLMRDAGHADIRAITLSFDEFTGTPDDETPLAQLVAAHYGAEHIIRKVTADDFEEHLPAILESMDQPSIDGVNTWFVAKVAREAGLKVALSGLGGDELLAGYPSFVDVPRAVRTLSVISRIPGLGGSVRRAVQATGLASGRPKLAGLLEYGGDYAGAYMLRRASYLPFELGALLQPDVVAQGLSELDPLGRLEGLTRWQAGASVPRVAALETAHYLRNQLLRDADWAGMAHGVEIRTPLVDYRLLQNLAPVIPNLTPGAGKRALAMAPSRALPQAVLDRGKSGFFVPTGAWMAGSRARRAGKGMASRAWLLEVAALHSGAAA